MLCETGLNPSTLQDMCASFVLRPETLYTGSNQQYAQCCQAPFVNDTVAICGRNITVGGLDGVIQVKRHLKDMPLKLDQLISGSEF